MVDPILKDVKELIMMEVGNPEILERIKRAAENDEVISRREREYIMKLAEEHLRQPEEDASIKDEVEDEVEDVVEPEARPTRRDSRPAHKASSSLWRRRVDKPQKPKDPKRQVVQKQASRLETATIQWQMPFDKRILMAAVGAAVVAVAVVVYLAGFNSGIEVDQPVVVPVVPTSELEIDQSSYSEGEIILLSGTVDAELDEVQLQVIDPVGTVLWSDNSKIRNDNSFSNMLIAGGSGWISTGEYEIKSLQGDKEIVVKFSYEG